MSRGEAIKMTQALNGQLRRQRAFRTRIVRFEVAKVSDEVCESEPSRDWPTVFCPTWVLLEAHDDLDFTTKEYVKPGIELQLRQCHVGNIEIN